MMTHKTQKEALTHLLRKYSFSCWMSIFCPQAYFEMQASIAMGCLRKLGWRPPQEEEVND